MGGLYAFKLYLDQKPAQVGANLYRLHCLNCHQEAGQGLKKLIPPLAGADFLVENQAALACIIREGMEGPIVVNGIAYDFPMPGNEVLSDYQIQQIIYFINQSWGNQLPPQSINEVKGYLEKCDSP